MGIVLAASAQRIPIVFILVQEKCLCNYTLEEVILNKGFTFNNN